MIQTEVDLNYWTHASETQNRLLVYFHHIKINIKMDRNAVNIIPNLFHTFYKSWFIRIKTAKMKQG